MAREALFRLSWRTQAPGLRVLGATCSAWARHLIGWYGVSMCEGWPRWGFTISVATQLKHRRCIDRTGSLRDLVACMTSPNPDSRPTLKEVANVLGRTPSSPVLGDGVAGAVAPASKGAPLPAVVHGLSDVVAPTSMRVPAWLWSDFHYPVPPRPLAAMINTVDESL